MEEMVTSGVEQSVAAEQTTQEGVSSEQTQQTQENTGVETQAAAVPNEAVEKAFAARLKEAVEKAKQEARDAIIAEMGYVWNGKPITTEAEYKEALREYELMQKYQSQGLPDEVVQELVESRKFREQYTAKEQEMLERERKAQEERDFISRRDAMYEEFLTEFPDYTTEEKWKTIPKEVWAEADKWLKSGGREGRRLADALTRYNWKMQMSQQQAAEANQANAQASTGSAKGQGLPESGFISRDVYEANKHDQAWMLKNYDLIKKSMSKWRK